MGKAGTHSAGPTARSVTKTDIGANGRLKIITYNIHSCIHMDGRIDPDRTADVIAALDPDIAMLQEVDVNRRRTQFMHQADYLANRLGLACRFFPVLKNGGERYGLAILSRFPFVTLKCIRFPHERKRWSTESRGAMLAALDTPLGLIRMVNTHLGLRRYERRRQVSAILGNEWVQQPLQANTPLIMCGDFNAGAQSVVYKKLAAHVSDVQMMTTQKGYPKATFFSRWPILRLDHIFISKHFRPSLVRVPSDHETRLVSDHLPLYCELVAAAQ